MKDIRMKKRILLAIANGLLLLLAALLCIFSVRLKSILPSQQFAARWASDGNRYGQVSVFLADAAGLTEESLADIVTTFDQKLEEVSIASSAGDEGGMPWTYGYSAERLLSINQGDITVEASATGVGENFFLFHPLRLVSGSYIWGSDLMSDRVVIDVNLAWQLFGATDVAGMEIEIGSLTYIIAGVVSPEDDFTSTAAYGDKPRIYLPYESMLLYDADTKITCLEVLLPSPVTSFPVETVKSVLEGLAVNEADRTLTNNTARYSLSGLFGVIGDFGLRSMRQAGFAYPYWENAARMVEDYLALFLVLTALLLVCPAVSLICLILSLWQRRNWRAGDLKEWVLKKTDAKRERKS